MLDKNQEYSALVNLFVSYFHRNNEDQTENQKHLKSIASKLMHIRKTEYHETTRQAMRKIHEDLYSYLALSITRLASYFDEQTNLEARNMITYARNQEETNKDMKIGMLEAEIKALKRELIELRFDNLDLEEKNKKLRNYRRAVKIDTKEALMQIALVDLLGSKDAYIIQQYNEAIAIISEAEGIELYTSASA